MFWNPWAWGVLGDRAAGDRMNGALAFPSSPAWRKRRWREAIRPGDQGSRRAEIRSPLKVDHRRSEFVLIRRGRILGDRLHAIRTTDRDVGEFWRIVQAAVLRQPEVRCLREDEPDRVPIRRPLV